MNSLAQCIATGFILLFFQQAIAAESKPDPQSLINQMSAASRSLNYDGVFMYRIGNQINTMRIVHKVTEDGVHEKLTSLTGHANEIIRDNEQVKCYFPENNSLLIDESRLGKLVSSYLPSPIESISDYYTFETVGQGRVAGRNAWVVNIRPRDEFRYGYQLWIDEQSKLLLKSELKNQTGTPLEQIIFAQIQISGDIDDALLKPSFSDKGVTLINNIQHSQSQTNEHVLQWKATWMPAGFNMNEHSRQAMMTSDIPVDHLVYSDGLAMVSIFIEKLSLKPGKNEGPSKFGGVNTYSTTANGYQITAVGEVPTETVKQMADSVESLN